MGPQNPTDHSCKFTQAKVVVYLDIAVLIFLCIGDKLLPFQHIWHFSVFLWFCFAFRKKQI